MSNLKVLGNKGTKMNNQKNSDLIDAYHGALREATKFNNDLYNLRVNPVTDFADKQKNTDALANLTFSHKTALDRLITAAEERIKKEKNNVIMQRVYDDLTAAGFNFEKHAVNHPLIQEIYLSIKRREPLPRLTKNDAAKARPVAKKSAEVLRNR